MVTSFLIIVYISDQIVIFFQYKSTESFTQDLNIYISVVV